MGDVVIKCVELVECLGVLVVNVYLYNDLFLVIYFLWVGLLGY